MAIINTPEEVRAHLPSAYTKTLENLPGFGAAEEEFLIPIIGDELYMQLQGDSLTEKLQKLRVRCQAVIVPFAYAAALPLMQTMISDNGIIALEADGQRKAYKWEYREAQEALQKQGFAAQELLITFLTVNKTDYPVWSSAPYNNTKNFAFIRNGKDLAGAIDIVQPQRSFMHMKGLFAETGMLDLRAALGDAYYDALSAKLFACTVTNEKEKQVVESLQCAAARLVMAKLADRGNVRFSASGGFTVADVLKDRPDENQKGAALDQLSTFAAAMRTSANAYLDRALDILNANAGSDLFSEFFTSNKYANPHDGGLKLQADRNGFFAI